MKVLRYVLIGAVIFGALCLFSNASFADEGAAKAKHEAKIKLIKDSAAALQQSNPALAKELSDLASDEEKGAQDWKERKEKHEARTKLLMDSSAALEKTNPDLAKGLKEMAEKKHSGKKHGSESK